MEEFLIYCKQTLPPLNSFAKRHLQNISQDLVSHCMEHFIYKVQFLFKKILLTFSYSKSLLSTISLHWPTCFKPSMTVLSQIIATFASFSINSENDTKTIFYRKHYLSLSTKNLNLLYNRKYFLKVLYFFLNKICSTCNDGN